MAAFFPDHAISLAATQPSAECLRSQKPSPQPIQAGNSYEKLGRWKTVLLLVTNVVGIGVLNLPLALRYLGLIPGIITIVGLGLAATYAAYILGQFYRCYPAVMNIVDCCQIVGGRPLA